MLTTLLLSDSIHHIFKRSDYIERLYVICADSGRLSSGPCAAANKQSSANPLRALAELVSKRSHRVSLWRRRHSNNAHALAIIAARVNDNRYSRINAPHIRFSNTAVFLNINVDVLLLASTHDGVFHASTIRGLKADDCYKVHLKNGRENPY